MDRSRIVYSLMKIPLDMIGVFGAFFVAGFLRSRTDLIPYVQLPIQTISREDLLLFASFGVIIWITLFYVKGLYKITPDTPLSEEIIETGSRAFSWFIFFIGVVYLSSGFLFTSEIPRLVIFFAFVMATLGAIFIRIGVYLSYLFLSKNGHLAKQRILIIGEDRDKEYRDTAFTHYDTEDENNTDEIRRKIRYREIDAFFYLGKIRYESVIREYIDLCKIYGVRFAYPKIEKNTAHIPQREGYIGGTPVMEVSAVTIEPMERVVKRILDILFAFLGLVLLFPLFCIIAIAIKIEDPSGPIFYRNRRVGLGGEEFLLYKFRYMYWKYCVKDGYGVEKEKDNALTYEENLKHKNNTRIGPLYKIQNDPRKSKIGKILEKFSLDELPQLWNVLRGDMSLVGPRPHQPREVEVYEEYQYQVLTIKPGMTGMAQTHGREKNKFSEEVALDTYYIEHYSLGLDIIILLRTLGVVLAHALEK